jgi:hypothetical protein
MASQDSDKKRNRELLRQQLRQLGQAYMEDWDEPKINRLADEVESGKRTLRDIDRDVSARVGRGEHASRVEANAPGASDANAADDVSISDAAAAARRLDPAARETLEGQIRGIGQAYMETWDEAKVDRLANQVQSGQRTLRDIDRDVSARVGRGEHASRVNNDTDKPVASTSGSSRETLEQQIRGIGQAYMEDWDQAKVDRLATQVQSGQRTLRDIDRDVSARIGRGGHASQTNSQSEATPSSNASAARETLENQVRTIGQAYGESWDAAKVDRLANEVQGGGRSLREIERDVSARIGAGGHQSRTNDNDASASNAAPERRSGGGAGSERAGQPLDKQPLTAAQAADGRVTGEEFSFGGNRYVTGSDGMPTRRDAVDKPGMAHLQDKGKHELDEAAKVFGTSLTKDEQENLHRIAAQMEADKNNNKKKPANTGGSSIRSSSRDDALINVTSGGKSTKMSLKDVQKKYGGGFSL